MMRVQLAYPWTDENGSVYDPDTILEVPTVVARRLVNEGRARTVPVVGTVTDLRDQAAADGIDLSGARNKGDVVAAIEASQPLPTTPVTVVAPDQPVADSNQEDSSGR